MKTMIHIKTDIEVKENAQALATKLGLSLSDVLNAALRSFIKTRQVVFSDSPTMTPELEKLLDEVDADIKNRPNLSPSFKSGEKIDKYLDSLSDR